MHNKSFIRIDYAPGELCVRGGKDGARACYKAKEMDTAGGTQRQCCAVPQQTYFRRRFDPYRFVVG
ncbi:MAG: hypothetical protein ABSD71_15690 [Bacteroidales bacterium]